MYDFKTLPEALDAAAKTDATITFVEGAESETRLAVSQLRTNALLLLGRLQRHGLVPADELVVHVEDNQRFLEAFWACLLGGIVPVPIAPGISDEHRLKLVRVFRRLRNPTLFASASTLERLANSTVEEEEFAKLRARVLLADETPGEPGFTGEPGKPLSVDARDLAFVQFSSGSTSEPKGVMLTHDNVLTNVRAIIAGAELGPDDKTLSWMPLSHDMGMIGFHLTPLVLAVDQVLIPSDVFVRRPGIWMSKATETRATLLCSPNFGYKHFLKSLERRDPGALDLSAVRVLFNGAEPISVGLCREFTDRMSAFGLSAGSMFPVYGLAEASVAVSFPKVGTGVSAVHVQRASLKLGGRVLYSAANDPQSVPFACVGQPVPDCEVRITGDEGQVLGSDTVGHVEIRGRNVTSGYYEDEENTRAAARGEGWLATGDLGFLGETGLVISGRHKDILFSNGQNFFPHDLESILQREVGLELGKVAVAGHRAPDADSDDVLVFVVHKGDLDRFQALIGQISAALSMQMGVDVTHVIPIARIPKTTSGKAQRGRLADAFADGDYAQVLAELKGMQDAADPGTAAERPEDAGESIASRLLSLCQGLLTARNVGLDDNLFEIGTSSIELAQIHEGIEKAFPGAVDITDLFDYPTVAELAKFLEGKLAGR